MKILKHIFLTLALSLTIVGGAQASSSCPSPEVFEKVDELLGASAYILKNMDFVETTYKNRKVLKLKNEYGPGKPPYLHPKLKKSIRDKIEKEGWTNLTFMKNGQPPIGSDGLQMNMHHVEGMEPGIMAELPASIHKMHHKVLHDFIETSWRKLYPEREKEYRKWRINYWKEQAKLYVQ